ncbi:hypothetical protein [Bacillus sp. FJAT-47783]|uniref:hypothetical protein n=1 Tax=Bacillus sp. FJAT-47783 TaxID=2922712 RepID=UPI001FADC5C5|nr:hypothetical protein [Bacillus sp. FJAT-47783]
MEQINQKKRRPFQGMIAFSLLMSTAVFPILLYLLYGLQLMGSVKGYWPFILFYTTFTTGVFIWIPIVSKVGIYRSLQWSVAMTIISMISTVLFQQSSIWLEVSALITGFSVSATIPMTTTLLYRHVERGGDVFTPTHIAIVIGSLFLLLNLLLFSIQSVGLSVLFILYGASLIVTLLIIRRMDPIEKVKETPIVPIGAAVGRFLLISLLVIAVRVSRMIQNEQMIFLFLIVSLVITVYMIMTVLKEKFIHSLSSSLPKRLQAESFLLGLGNGYLLLIGMFYSLSFYNILISIYIVLVPYLAGLVLWTLVNDKLIKNMNPLNVFIISTFFIVFGFISPVLISIGILLGSYVYNMVSTQNNMKVYKHDLPQRELSILIHMTYRKIGNILLQFFVFVVIIFVGVYYNVDWYNLFQLIIGNNKVDIPGISGSLLMVILSFCCWSAMVGLVIWINKLSKQKAV